MKRLSSAACVAAAFGLIGALGAADAQAKQCVFNKGGYVLHIRWFRVADVVAPDARNYYQLAAANAPVQQDNLTVGTGACTKTDEVLTAAISVVGCVQARDSAGGTSFTRGCNTHILAGTLLTQAGRSQEATCPRGVSSCDATVAETVDTPEPKRFASELLRPLLIVTPKTTHYLDFWGTIFDVAYGGGGPIQ